MRYLFIGLFIIAFLSGITAMYFNQPFSGHDVLRTFLDNIGITAREKTTQDQTTARVNSNLKHMAKMKEIIEALNMHNQDLMESIDDQKHFLENTGKQVESLSQMVENMSDKTNVDLLRLKSLMADFSRQNRLLIENGRQLLRFNQEQLKIRQQTMQDANIMAYDSNLHQNGFLQYAKQASDQREDFINQSMVNIEGMREQTQMLSEHLSSLEDNLTTPQDAQLVEKLKDMSAQSREMLANIKINEQRLDDLKQQQNTQLAVLKENLDDFIAHGIQQDDDAKQRSQDQKELIKERTQDELDRLQSQREH